MKKTRKYVNQRLDIYMAGRNAAKNNEPRFAPYLVLEFVRTWFAGFDSVKDLTGNRTSVIIKA